MAISSTAGGITGGSSLAKAASLGRAPNLVVESCRRCADRRYRSQDQSAGSSTDRRTSLLLLGVLLFNIRAGGVVGQLVGHMYVCVVILLSLAANSWLRPSCKAIIRIQRTDHVIPTAGVPAVQDRLH
jgi:hypothetical protein